MPLDLPDRRMFVAGFGVAVPVAMALVTMPLKAKPAFAHTKGLPDLKRSIRATGRAVGFFAAISTAFAVGAIFTRNKQFD